MRNLLYIFLLFFPAVLFGQVVKTAAVPYTKGSGYTPNIAGSSELRVDTAASALYWWDRDALTWIRFRPGVDVITGSVAPSYTPRDNQSLFAVNADSEVFYHNGSAWVQVGGGAGAGGIYGGSGTTGAAFTTATIDSIMRFLGDEATDRFIAAVAGGADVASVSVYDTTAQLYYDYPSGTNTIEANNEGATITLSNVDKLTVTNQNENLFQSTATSSTTGGGLLTLAAFDGAALNSGHRLGSLRYSGQTAAATYTVGATIDAYSHTGWGASEARTYLSFNTVNGGGTTLHEKMRLMSNSFGTAYSLELRDRTRLDLYNTGNTTNGRIEVGDSSIYVLSPGAVGDFQLSGKIGITRGNAPNLSADANNWHFGGNNGFYTLTATGATRSVTGMQAVMGTSSERVVIFHNNGSEDIVFVNNSGSSSAANRFDIDSDFTLEPNQAAIFLYDTGESVWRIPNRPSTSAATSEVNVPATIRPAQITATTNDYNPTGYSTTVSQVIQVDGDGSFRTITGLTAATRDGVEKTFDNDGTNCYIVAKQHTGSSAANRFDITKDVVMFPGMQATFRYDSVATKWRLKATSKENSVFYNYVEGDIKRNMTSVNSGDSEFWANTSNGGASQLIGANGTGIGSLRRCGLNTFTAATAWPTFSTKSQIIHLEDNVSYIRIAASVYFDDLSTGAQDYDFRMGFKGTLDTNVNEGMYISYVLEENSGGFTLKTHDGSTLNSVNAGSPIAADTYYNIELIYYPYGEVTAFIDGVRYTTTSNLPTLVSGSPFLQMDKDNGTTAASMLFRDFDVFGANVSD